MPLRPLRIVALDYVAPMGILETGAWKLAMRATKSTLNRLGYEVRRKPLEDGDLTFPTDVEQVVRDLYKRVQPYTMTSVERVLALRDSVRYVSSAKIPGDICECGVWRGGSMMVVAITLVELGDTSRDLYLFDTFAGPPEPGSKDSPTAGAELAVARQVPQLANLPVEEVRGVLEDTGYPGEKIHLIKGLVEDTIPDRAPEHLALLRLDTDYYSSTAHEMRHMYGRLSPGGILIVDDYGKFVGARTAVDEYFGSTGQPVLLNRIDATGRLVVVPG